MVLAAAVGGVDRGCRLACKHKGGRGGGGEVVEQPAEHDVAYQQQLLRTPGRTLWGWFMPLQSGLGPLLWWGWVGVERMMPQAVTWTRLRLVIVFSVLPVRHA